MGEIIARNMLSCLKLLIKLLLLHPVGCLYYCISDARSQKHKNIYIQKLPNADFVTCYVVRFWDSGAYPLPCYTHQAQSSSSFFAMQPWTFRLLLLLPSSPAAATVTTPWLPPPPPIRFHNNLLIFLMYASVWFPLNDQVTVVYSCQLC